MKLAMFCDFIALIFLKSTSCSDSTIDRLLIWPNESLLPKISFRDWFINNHIVWSLEMMMKLSDTHHHRIAIFPIFE
jgi:hypothetical protein